MLPAFAQSQTWATAVSKNKADGTAIIFRYIKDLGPNFKREVQPIRVIISWKYEGPNGMPASEMNVRMNELEDALYPAVAANGLATLALVSTGNGLKEWIFYSKTEAEFFSVLNKSLGRLKPFPIEIHVAEDRVWRSYEEFRTSVEE